MAILPERDKFRNGQKGGGSKCVAKIDWNALAGDGGDEEVLRVSVSKGDEPPHQAVNGMAPHKVVAEEVEAFGAIAQLHEGSPELGVSVRGQGLFKISRPLFRRCLC